jgi:hypothetical protein
MSSRTLNFHFMLRVVEVMFNNVFKRCFLSHSNYFIKKVFTFWFVFKGCLFVIAMPRINFVNIKSNIDNIHLEVSRSLLKNLHYL